MTQYKTKLIIIAVLSCIAVYFFVSDTNNTFSSEFEPIHVKDTSLITKIVISNDSTEVSLERKSGYWRLNNQYSARPKALARMLATLGNLQMVSPVPQQQTDSINRVLTEKGVKVTVFNHDQKLAEYVIGHLAKGINGSYLKTGDNERPLIAESLGSYFPLSRIFVPYEGYWRDLSVFRYHVADIKSITVEYPRAADNSYKLHIGDGKNIHLSDLKGLQTVHDLNKESVVQYLSYFSNVLFERVARELPSQSIDSIIAMQPEVIVSVEDQQGNVNKIETYLKPNKNAKTKNDYKFDIYRMYGRINDNKELVVVQYQFFDPLFKQPAYFVIK